MGMVFGGDGGPSYWAREAGRLEKIISDLKLALEPLATAANYYDDHFPDDTAIVVYHSAHTKYDKSSEMITIGDARRARDVLKRYENIWR